METESYSLPKEPIGCISPPPPPPPTPTNKSNTESRGVIKNLIHYHYYVGCLVRHLFHYLNSSSVTTSTQWWEDISNYFPTSVQVPHLKQVQCYQACGQCTPASVMSMYFTIIQQGNCVMMHGAELKLLHTHNCSRCGIYLVCSRCNITGCTGSSRKGAKLNKRLLNV